MKVRSVTVHWQREFVTSEDMLSFAVNRFSAIEKIDMLKAAPGLASYNEITFTVPQ